MRIHISRRVAHCIRTIRICPPFPVECQFRPRWRSPIRQNRAIFRNSRTNAANNTCNISIPDYFRRSLPRDRHWIVWLRLQKTPVQFSSRKKNRNETPTFGNASLFNAFVVQWLHNIQNYLRRILVKWIKINPIHFSLIRKDSESGTTFSVRLGSKHPAAATQTHNAPQKNNFKCIISGGLTQLAGDLRTTTEYSLLRL